MFSAKAGLAYHLTVRWTIIINTATVLLHYLNNKLHCRWTGWWGESPRRGSSASYWSWRWPGSSSGPSSSSSTWWACASIYFVFDIRTLSHKNIFSLELRYARNQDFWLAKNNQMLEFHCRVDWGRIYFCWTGPD